MTMLYRQLELKFRDAFNALGVADSTPIVLQESSRPEFGDYQVNGVMAAAKQLKMNPRELAQQVIDKVELAGIADKLEIAGPGFINITLNNQFLQGSLVALQDLLQKEVLSINNNEPQKVIVVDYSSPNLAKEMHVGHLRSTVIGDALVRINEYLGNRVIRQNHVGDWGTQFGMLIAYMLEHDLLGETPRDTNGNYLPQSGIDPKYANTTKVGYSFKVKDLEVFYQSAKKHFDEDQEFANRARQYVVKLQGNSELLPEEQTGNSLLDASGGIDGSKIITYWTIFRDESLRHCQEVYDKLGVKLTTGGGRYGEGDVCGESFYEKVYPGGLGSVIDKLVTEGLLTESNGAKCVFFSENELPGGGETPFIVQKNDGGYLYSTTDLAAVDYRTNKGEHNFRFLNADKVLYVVDARQAFHFKQLFIVAKKAGFAKPGSELTHVPFGTMMGEDGKPFKTRSGGTVKLIDLINEAIDRAYKMIKERNSEWAEVEIFNLAETIGIASMKYSDLSKNRLSDYSFSFDKMLAFDGNTAPYLLYAYTRIVSIFKKADLSVADFTNGTIEINEVAEHYLAVHLAKFVDRIIQAGNENYPHYLCSYIYELAGLFMKFYESCPILKSDIPDKQKDSRLRLALLTANTLKKSLGLLGINVVDKM